MIVMKFGGSSVEDATAIRRVVGIIGQFLDRQPLVVVSAMGKTTNGLLECGRLAAEGSLEEALRGLRSLADRHQEAAAALALPAERTSLAAELAGEFAELERLLAALGQRGELTLEALDGLAANGELLSSRIVAAALRGGGQAGTWVDIRPALRTNDDFTRAAVRFEEANPRLVESFAGRLAAGQVPVTQGFIGSTEEGRTTTIGRGGSDYSAAIIGAALGAEEIQIWTDVDGILSTDPRVVPSAVKLRTLSFAEAAELAYFGAKVLHPSTLLPAMAQEIPVRVCNSRRPMVPGTAIVRQAPASPALIKAIAFKRGITVVNVSSDRMLMAHGFLARLFALFDKYETAIDMVATSEVSVSMTLDETRRLDEILPELRALGEVTVERDLALVCLVGEQLKYVPGLAAEVFGAIAGINVSMISHGASAINLSFIVEGARVEEAVQALHARFFADPDPATFEVPARAASAPRDSREVARCDTREVARCDTREVARCDTREVA